MHKRPVRKVIALLLVTCLSLGVLPGSWAAEEAPEDAPVLAEPAQELTDAEVTPAVQPLAEASVPEIIGYEEACRQNHILRLYEEEGDDLNKVIFLNADGTRTLYLYDFPVKYVDSDGLIRDKSLEIATAESGFRTASGDAVTTFAAKMSEGISLAGNGVSLRMVPVTPSAPPLTGSVTADDKVQLVGSQQAQRIDSKTVRYVYDSKTTLEYSLTYTGFKEDIVVSQYTGQTEYDFLLYTNGCALQEMNGSYFLVDDQGNIKATIGDIIIFTADERNNTFGRIEPTTIVENEQYLLTIVVDADFLADEKTAYPIRIDPTVEINYDSDSAGIQDVTVCDSTTYSGTSGSLYIGNKEGVGLCRALMKFPALSFLHSSIEVQSATLTMRDLMCESREMDIYCHIFNGNTWSETGATWSGTNAGASSSIEDQLDMVTMGFEIGDELSPRHWYSFDITTAVQYWAMVPACLDQGIILKLSAADETGTASISRTLGSYNRSENKPYFSMTYYDSVTSVVLSPTSITMTNGNKRALTVTIYPTTAENKAVSWRTSNPAIAKVSTTGEITAVSPGIATITCTSLDSGAKATCTVTVIPNSYLTMTEADNYAVTISNGKHMWFSFTPSETCYYMFQSTSDTGTDVEAYLYLGTTQIDHDDDGADEDSQFEIRYRLEAGNTYKLKVQGYSTSTTGSCRVSVNKCWPEVNEPDIKSRALWGAADIVQDRLVPRTREPVRIIYHHSADKFSSTNILDCINEIKRIQELHMNQEGKCDIAYHFIIDPAGRIWQGAAIDDYQRGHATNHFDDIGVLVLGDFESRLANWWQPNTLNNAQKEAMVTIAKWLCYEYELPFNAINGPVTTHRQVNPGSTVCPGNEMAPWVENDLLNLIINWRK